MKGLHLSGLIKFELMNLLGEVQMDELDACFRQDKIGWMTG